MIEGCLSQHLMEALIKHISLKWNKLFKFEFAFDVNFQFSSNFNKDVIKVSRIAKTHLLQQAKDGC